MDIKKLMKTSAATLQEIQHRELKLHAIEILTKVIYLIKEERYADVLDFTQSSPAGDGMGDDNTFIDFAFSGNENGDDIDTLVTTLINLRK